MREQIISLARDSSLPLVAQNDTVGRNLVVVLGLCGKMYPDSEILFPSRCIPQLRDLRGPEWAGLIDHITTLPDGHEDVLAFSLMMIKLGSCLTCDLDSYRASLGCCTCAGRTVGGFKGSDKDIIRLFEENRERVRAYLDSGEVPETIAALVTRPS